MITSVTASAPGRVELLGNHTDYNLGVVLAAAIDRTLTVTGAGRAEPVAAFHSASVGAPVEVPLARLQPQTRETWANYGLGVAHQLIGAGYPVAGFNAAITGDLPPGSGLSSSAAFEVATAYFLRKLFAFEIAPQEIARLCRAAENDFVGVRSGLLDQTTSVFGRAGHVVYLDCASDKVETIPFLQNVALVIAESGTKHSLLAGDYNARREECAAAAKALHVTSLREITSAQLNEKGASLDPLLRKRAAHIVGENDRVWRALKCFEGGDAAGMGALMDASHESSRTNFENSTPELDALVSLARTLPGVLGSRLTGGGFGGSTVTLVESSRAPEVADAINARWLAQSGHSANAFVCRIADGAEILARR